MIWKGCVVLSLALCVLCDRRPAFSEVQVIKHNKELSHDHQKSENHEEYANAHPSYEFSYKVDDPHTHDKKEQQETRDGDKVSGHYWLIQPDGHKRLVKYQVDGKRGFSADVNYALNKHEVHYNTKKHDDDEKKDEEHIIEHIDEKPQEVHHGKGDEEVIEIHEKIEEPEHKGVEEHKEHVDEHKEHADEHKEHVEEHKEQVEEHKEHDEEHKVHDEEHNEPDEAHNEQKEEKFGDKIYDQEVKHETHENHDDTHNEPEKKDDKEHHDKQEPKPKGHHDFWSSIRNWGNIDRDEHEDVWSWPKLINWDIVHDKNKHQNNDAPKVHEENDKKHGNSWKWQKSYDVWEVQHYGNDHEHDEKPHDVKEEEHEKPRELEKPREHEKPKEQLFFPASEENDKKKESNFGLRDHEHRGQPSYHMPIMKAKPIPYRRRRLYKSSA